MDPLFQIEEIGRPAVAHSGLPDSCELCGHCLFLRFLAHRAKAAKSGCAKGEADANVSNIDLPR